eukprot:m.31185 g.31185  ORF g.31185 m.31185 type:complete len:226 (+) comp6907_c0_seq1:3006-3683(+)
MLHVKQPSRKETQLYIQTPDNQCSWRSLQGTPVLIDNYGREYRYDPPFFHHGYPTYVYHGRYGEYRVFRDGDTWWYARQHGFDRRYGAILHMARGDPNLPPLGCAWKYAWNGKKCPSMKFYVAPGFEETLIETQAKTLGLRWRIDGHTRFPQVVRDWVVVVLLCNRRHRTRECRDQSDCPGLPIELWLVIFSGLQIYEMIPPRQPRQPRQSDSDKAAVVRRTLGN